MSAADSVPLRPSARTLDSALLRLLAACSRAERGAQDAADEMGRSEFLLALLRHRHDAVGVIEDLLGVAKDDHRSRGAWRAWARFAIRALRGVLVEPSDAATYVGEAALADGAIAACNDLLRMLLPDRTRRSIERVHASLESDRRRMRQLARLE